MLPGDAIALQILVRLVFGVLLAAIAGSRGRNRVVWFLLGAVFTCFALILVLVLPDLAAQRAKEEAVRREQARLRELLTQERMKNQAFRKHAGQRLDAHDAVLGLETRQPATALESGAAAAEGLETGEDGGGGQAALPAGGWYLAEAGGEPEGPLGLEEVAGRVRERLLDARTLVWHPSLDAWTPLERSPLAGLLG